MIRFLADENIPIKDVETLKKNGIDIISVLDISQGLSDREVVDIANRQGRIIITFDTDFGRFAFKEKQKVNGIILLRFIPRSPQEIAERIQHILTVGIPLINQFIVIKEDRIRTIPIR